MKRFLLSFAVLATTLFGASAGELYKLTFGVTANQEKCNQYNQTWTLTQDGKQWLLTGFSNNNNGWTDVRYGTKTASAITDGVIVSSFVIEGAVNEVVLNGRLQKSQANDNWTSCKVQSSATSDFAVLTNDVEVAQSDFTSSNSDVVVTLPNPTENQYYRVYIVPGGNNGAATNNGWFALQSITFNGTAGEMPSIEAPTFTLTENGNTYLVSIECATEGVEIYYTIDGTTPTTESTKYTEPIALTYGKFNVKAIAVKDGDTSLVGAQTYNLAMKTSDLSELVGLDADALTALGGSLEFDFTGTLTYAFQSGSNLYLTDGTNNIKLYGGSTVYAAGDTFNSLKGTYAYRYAQPQITNYTLSAPVAGGEIVKPVEVADAAVIVAANDNNWYTVKGVEIKNVSGKNATLVDANGTEVALYNDLACEGFEAATNVNVSGFVGVYNTQVQFLPTEITNAEGEEFVATPEFSLADGAYPENTVIEISCATEGATIVYTVNDGDVEESTENVTLTLTEDMTVVAYATKEGMEDSRTVTATYTIKVAQPISGTTATFDFSAEEFSKIDCDPAQSTYPGDNVENLSDYVLSVNGVSLSFEKGEGASTDVRLWNNGNQLRMYKGNIMHVAIEAGYKLDKISFTCKSGASAIELVEGEPGTFANSVWTATVEEEEESRAGNAVSQVSFTTTASVQITGINVDFSKISTSIEAVDVEESDNAVYYNLQGVRVENPANGLYIRVAGKTASKVFVR